MSEVVIYHHLYNRIQGHREFKLTDELNTDMSSEGCHSRQSDALDVSPQPVGTVMPVLPVKPFGRASTVFIKFSRFLALIGVALILFFYAPRVLALGGTVISSTFENFKISTTEILTLKSHQNTSKTIILPPFDPRLPASNRLLIPSIGVDTQVQEATLGNYEEALRKGAWRVSDFGAPNDNAGPIILAAHRFGYLTWTNTFRHNNSFYNLPKVEVKDLIEIDWNQRKYLYEVYAVSKGTQILDYSADLILYTCETLTGDNKIFVYARLIQI